MSLSSLPPKHAPTSSSPTSKKGKRTLLPGRNHLDFVYRIGSYHLNKLPHVHVEGDYSTSIPMFYVENGKFITL
jgi:hypothetical protein